MKLQELKDKLEKDILELDSEGFYFINDNEIDDLLKDFSVRDKEKIGARIISNSVDFGSGNDLLEDLLSKKKHLVELKFWDIKKKVKLKYNSTLFKQHYGKI